MTQKICMGSKNVMGNKKRTEIFNYYRFRWERHLIDQNNKAKGKIIQTSISKIIFDN